MKIFQRLTLTFLTTLALTTHVSAGGPTTELTLDVSTVNVDVSGALSADTIHKTGVYTLTLSADNAIGNLDIQAGAVSINKTSRLHASAPAVSFTSGGGTLNITDAAAADADVAINANVTTANGTFNVSTGVTGKLGIITGISSSNTLTKAGPGTLSVSADNSAAAAGITVTAGILSVATANALPAKTTLNAGTLALTDDITTAREIAMAADSYISVASGKTATLGGAAALLTGGHKISKIGTGTLALSGDKSSATTAFIVSAGTLSIGASNQLPTSDALTLAGGTLLTTATMLLPLPIALTAASTLDTGTNAVTHSQALTGAYALTKAGSGTLTFSGNKSTSDSTVAVNAGTLSISAANALPGTSLALTGGTLATTASLTIANQAITLSADSTINTTAATTTTIISALTETGGRTLTKSGTGSLAVTSDISSFTGIAVTAGTLIATEAEYLPVTTTLNGATAVLSLADGVTSERTIAVGVGGGTVNVAAGEATLGGEQGSLTGANTLTKTGAGTLTLSGEKNQSPTTVLVNAGILKANADENFPAAIDIASGATLQIVPNGPIVDPITGGTCTITMRSGSILDLGRDFSAAITIAATPG